MTGLNSQTSRVTYKTNTHAYKLVWLEHSQCKMKAIKLQRNKKWTAMKDYALKDVTFECKTDTFTHNHLEDKRLTKHYTTI